jgi:CheY-like chemotaxis protein
MFRVTLRAAEPPQPSPVAEPVGAAARRQRILAIDDEPAMLQAVRRTLHDHDVVCAGTALEALALLERGERFDLIFSDMTMPKMNGMEFYERVLAEHPAAAPAIVFLTGGAVSQHTAEFLSVVRNPRLQKPIFPKALRAFVAEVFAAR